MAEAYAPAEWIDTLLAFAFPKAPIDERQHVDVLVVFETNDHAVDFATALFPSRVPIVLRAVASELGYASASTEIHLRPSPPMVAVGAAAYHLVTEEGRVDTAQLAGTFPGPVFVSPEVSWSKL